MGKSEGYWVTVLLFHPNENEAFPSLAAFSLRIRSLLSNIPLNEIVWINDVSTYEW